MCRRWRRSSAPPSSSAPGSTSFCASRSWGARTRWPVRRCDRQCHECRALLPSPLVGEGGADVRFAKPPSPTRGEGKEGPWRRSTFRGNEVGKERAYRALLVELLQFFSDDQTLRDRRKQSTGVDDPSASKRCSSTPLHWKPHFSKMLRDDGLATRAPEIRWSDSNSSTKKSITARAASVPN